MFYARNVKKLLSFYDNSDRGQDFGLLDSLADETSVRQQASLLDDGYHKIDWPYGILIPKDNMYASESGHVDKGCQAWILAINAALESERVGVGVLLIAVALAFRLDGGLLGFWDRGWIGCVARLKVH